MDRSPLACFGPFTFDRVRLLLRREGQPIAVGARGAAILAALVDAGGEVVTRAELLDAAWPGQAVEERNLTVQIAALRKAMGNQPDYEGLIRTVSRVGYRLASDVPRATILSLMPSVVVLPFANLSRDPNLAFFAGGVTDEVIAALSRFRTFAVVARGSSMALGTSAGPSAIAEALGVRYVIEGSVRREGHRLRVAARLTDAGGLVLWADGFEDDLGAVFDMQDRIAASVVGVVEPRIVRAELDRSRRKHPESLDAYDHFLLGVAEFERLYASSARYDRMVGHLDRAVQLDPSFPQALITAGRAHAFRRIFGASTPPGIDDVAIGLDLEDRALALAPDDPLVLTCKATQLHNHYDDGEGSLALAERAITMNPHSHGVLHDAAVIQRQRGRADSALALFERCLLLSPNSPGNAMTVENIGCCHLEAGRFDDAVDWFRRALAMGASWDFALVNLTVAHAMLGQAAEARSALERFLALRPGATIRGVMDRLPPGTRRSVETIWPEGLGRAGLPAA